MPKPAVRTWSRYTLEAVRLLGLQVRQLRLERKIPAQELAERAGISRGLLQRIEKGDAKCEIGAAFELAAILGIPLFQSDEQPLKVQLVRAADRLALLPKSAHKPREEVKDDF